MVGLNLPYKWRPGMECYSFVESDHPRAIDGRFGDKAGGGKVSGLSDDELKTIAQMTKSQRKKHLAEKGIELSVEDKRKIAESRWTSPEVNARKPQEKLEKGSVPDSEIDGNFATVDKALKAAGAVLDAESESGSRYYTMPDGKQIRVADHEANAATQHWKDKKSVHEIRTDKRYWKSALEQALENDEEDTQSPVPTSIPATPANPKSLGRS